MKKNINYANPSIPKDTNILDAELEKHYTLENQSFRRDHPKKFRLKYQGARDVILRKSHSRPTHSFHVRETSHFHQHGPPRRLLMPIVIVMKRYIFEE